VNPITHALVGWALAESVTDIERRERALIVIAGVAPDLDGFGLPFELVTRDTDHPILWWSEYHHVLGHNLLFASILAVGAFCLARTRRAMTALLAFVAAHLHLLGDLAGSRGPDGYDWPIPYLYPFSQAVTSWEGQWPLNAWPNIVITIALLLLAFFLAWKRGYSPVELFSRRADVAFIAALRKRFPRKD
jgi:inner membrane protein